MKILAVITAISGFIGVVFGAFGTHGLRGTVEPELLSVWQTAMQYQMFHVLVLLSIIIAGSRQSNRLLTIFWVVVCRWYSALLWESLRARYYRYQIFRNGDPFRWSVVFARLVGAVICTGEIY